MTNVRFPRGVLVHITVDLRNALCGKRLRRPIIEPDEAPTCAACLLAATTN